MDCTALREEIRTYLGLAPPGSPPAFQVLEEEECEGYSRFLISYGGSKGDEIPAYLLLPQGSGPFPGVLIHHQHNGERHLGKSEVVGLAGDFLQAFGPALAQRGFAVLAPDSICFEDRRPNRQGTVPDGDNDFFQHYNEMCYRLLRGSTLMKKVLDDANIGFNLLKNHPLVDEARIGVLGHSYGGNTAIFQMALNTELAFGCASGAACTYGQKMRAGTGLEMALVIPGFSARYELTDLVKCAAPRPFLLVSATEDKYSLDAHIIEAEARKTYAQLGAADRLVHHRYGGGHALTEERFWNIISWLVDTARGPTSP
jgi:dienelactone hydrolase